MRSTSRAVRRVRTGRTVRTGRLLLWGGLAAVAGGAVLCVIGWYGISGEVLVARQLPYLASSTVPGAALLVAGAVWVVAGVRDEAGGAAAEPEKRGAAADGDSAEDADGDADAGADAGVRPSSDEPPLRVPGGTLAHRPDCPLVTGRPEAVPVGDDDTGLGPCPVCEPWPR
ncbi:hypothetical protein ACIRSU_27615 [Streptomyces sp. NPDC101160]|uniref:hypothetical protein n=1 Tax=Streptomyces sp. NPDC101160 TaxID=3366118 RepID=UPI0038112E56